MCNTVNTKSLIDHILVSRNDKICISGTFLFGFSDHNTVFCTREISCDNQNIHRYVKFDK